MNKLLHEPTAALRGHADHPDRELLAELTRQLFALDPEAGSGDRTGD